MRFIGWGINQDCFGLESVTKRVVAVRLDTAVGIRAAATASTMTTVSYMATAKAATAIYMATDSYIATAKAATASTMAATAKVATVSYMATAKAA